MKKIINLFDIHFKIFSLNFFARNKTNRAISWHELRIWFFSENSLCLFFYSYYLRIFDKKEISSHFSHHHIFSLRFAIFSFSISSLNNFMLLSKFSHVSVVFQCAMRRQILFPTWFYTLICPFNRWHNIWRWYVCSRDADESRLITI